MTDVKAITNQRRALTADDISLLEAFSQLAGTLVQGAKR